LRGKSKVYWVELVPHELLGSCSIRLSGYLFRVEMKSFRKLGSALGLGCLAVGSAARAVGYTSPQDWIKPYKREALQDIVSLEKQVVDVKVI